MSDFAFRHTRSDDALADPPDDCGPVLSNLLERQRLRAMRMARSYILETAGFAMVDWLTETYANPFTGERVSGAGAWVYSSLLWTRVDGEIWFSRPCRIAAMLHRPAILPILLIHLLILVQTSLTQTQPLAEHVMDKSVEAIGGPASLNRIKTLHIAGDVYIETLSWRRIGSFESFSDASGKYINRSELDGHIVRRTGFDGKELWYADQMLMPATRSTPLKGVSDERTTHRFLLNNRFFPLADWRHYFGRVEVIGKTKIGRKTVIVIRGTLPDGDAHNLYFDSEQFLLLREEFAGRIKFTEDDEERSYLVTIDLSDYKVTDGIKFPRERLVQTQYGAERLVVTKVEINIPLKDGYSSKPN